MKLRSTLIGLVAALLVVAAGSASAGTLRVIVVETQDVGAYVKALHDADALRKKKGFTGQIRVWRATYAGDDAGAVVVSIEYPNLEALAKDNAMMQSDAEMRTWLQGLDKLRKIVSDSIYEEQK